MLRPRAWQPALQAVVRRRDSREACYLQSARKRLSALEIKFCTYVLPRSSSS